MSTLFITSYAPTLVSGTGVRTYGVVAALARSDDVELLYRAFGASEPAPAYRSVQRATLREMAATRGPARALVYAQARARSVPDDIARGVTPEIVAAARRAPSDCRIVADGPAVGAALLGVARRRPVVYCAHNLESAFRHRLSGERTSRTAMQRFERRLLAAMAETWMVSRADASGAEKLCPGARLRLVPNVVDVRAIVPVRPDPASRRVLFVGDLTYAPNQAAVAFLRDEVAPRLLAAAPGTEIVVAGRGGRPEDGGGQLRVLGFVDDLRALYESAAVVAVPLLQGGGSPLKFVEALAHGLPVVATPKAAAGLDAVPGEHYVEAGDAAAFADALAAVLRDGGAGIGARGRVLAEERYSIEALAEELRG